MLVSVYMSQVVPSEHFFEQSGGDETDKGSKEVEEGEMKVELWEIEDWEVGYPYESWMKEGSEGIEEIGGQRMIKLVNRPTDLAINSFESCQNIHG